MVLTCRLVARDRGGESLIIAFYPDNDTTEVLDTSKLKHHFLYGTRGVRVEDVSACRVFPVKLAELFRINSDLCAYTGPLGTLKKCHSCGKEDPSVVKCGRCGLYYYCNKTLGWNQKGHKEACRVLKDPNLRALFKITVGEGEHRFQFPR
ncbi:hypothetical protein CGCS363_v011600 [Colletotrichum siamense]|uniref:uncharacterized protein n=1 Tax=Colletotrichum siamense TaxID=690259 RepID=UPI0018726A8D|nr:uncharacterized protein CGCS363_v011600 [Colletotrichum siamense]KAF5491741.1 hypothetical protein CGCS363_v011600 [Colletotrichum siamense]